MGRRISKEFLHPSILEGVNDKIGNLDSLETDAKSNMVQAINELVEKLDNSAEIVEGKELIANAVGEPLTAEESFEEMSSDINGLLSTFKTNMMNNGITVEANDKFKSLIDKIATLADNEGKGIQYAEGSGSITFKSTTVDGYLAYQTFQIAMLDFTPNMVFVEFNAFSNIPGFIILSTNCTQDSPHILEYSSVNSYSHKIYLTVNGGSISVSVLTPTNSNTTATLNYYAIGVGEEDTTLRDSLADILENKGVELSGGETLEELIIKVGKLEAKLPPLYLYQEGVINTELIGDLIYSTDSDINYPTYTPGETDFYIGTHQTNSAASANLTAKNAIDTLKYRKICIDCETTCTGEDGPRVKFSFAGSELDITTSQNRQIVSFYFIPSKNAIFRLSAGNSFGWNGQAYTRVYNIWLEDEL